MTEYTLVFRRTVGQRPRARARAWTVARPAIGGPDESVGGETARETVAAREPSATTAKLAQLFVVPICSALGLDGVAYEHFLLESGALGAAVAVLNASPFALPVEVETARKEVQALVMEAEVQHIIDRVSA
jgi:hypothetical protein